MGVNIIQTIELEDRRFRLPLDPEDYDEAYVHAQSIIREASQGLASLDANGWPEEDAPLHKAEAERIIDACDFISFLMRGIF